MTEDASWGREKHVFLWTQELVSTQRLLAWPPTTTLAWPPTVDTTLASVATNHVGVKKNAQRAAERGGSQEHRKKTTIEAEMVAGEDIVALQALRALKAVQIGLHCGLGGRSNVQGQHGVGRV